MKMNDNQSGIRRFLTGVADNWIARGYLAVCAGLMLWVGLDATLVQHEDASLAAVWPVIATAPTSFLAVYAPLEGPAGATAYFVLVALAAGVNAWLISALLRRFQGQGRAVRA